MKKNQFNYTYSAPTEEERREIASIRKQYEPQEKTETKIERLRKLDGFVKNSATALSLVCGVVGCLVFGLGLTMILEWTLYVWGVAVCVVGAIPTALAYPVYKRILEFNKKKYGDEILKLTEELLNEK